MKREWTAEQKLAIDTRDRTLLVSAAAGAGKTATLTERIISTLLDEENPADIGSMLIVTFTNAAVGELRDRVSAAVGEAAEKNPDNERLKRQLLTVRDARIMTISSFCNEIVRARAKALGVPDNYRIADEAEAKLVLNDTLDGLLEAAFEGELLEGVSAEDFARLSDCLVGNRDDLSLSEVFRTIYEKTDAGVDRAAELGTLLDRLRFNNESPDESFFISYAVASARDTARELFSLLDRRLTLGNYTDKERAKMQVFYDDKDLLLGIASADSYATLHERMMAAAFGHRTAPRERGADYEELVALRDIYKSKIFELRDRFFLYSLEEQQKMHTDIYNLTEIFVKFLLKFDEVYSEEKLKRGVLTYSDLSRYAYLALWEGENKSAFARALTDSFSYVYIDEYQDVNDLDNKIFEAVSRPDNRFMVGDIKQSIYGFRLANPEIFEGMKTKFSKLGEAGDYPYAATFLSKNFRCDEPIVDFINSIFDKILPLVGGVAYEPSDRLGFAKKYKEGERPVGHIPQIHLVDTREISATTPEDAAEEEIASGSLLEARAVAKKIKELVSGGYSLASGRPIRPSDIAIVMRSTKTSGEQFRQALDEVGVSSSLVEATDFFFTREILLVLSLLNSIDNPRRDIYLASLMSSPLYRISPDMLVAIRKSSSSETLYEALLEYMESHPDYERGRRFLSDLKRYRTIAEGMRVDRLISILYRETGILSLLSAKGQRENLLLLHNYARSFEQSSFGGLYSFISYVNTVIENEGKIDKEDGSEGADAVSIMTVHKSKGLEFPVVFFAKTEAPMTRQDKSPVRFADGFGIALRERDPSGLVMVENPIFNAIGDYNAAREYEEELRVMYVALTRAREMLYIYAAPRSKTEMTLQKRDIARSLFSPYIAKNFSSMIDVILATAATEPYIDGIEQSGDGAPRAENESAKNESAPCWENEPYGKAPEGETENATEREVSTAVIDELVGRFNFKYPNEHLLGVPRKLSISKLNPAVLDGTEGEVYELDGEKQPREARGIIPAFISGKPADESARRGIATHTYLQFASFEALGEEGGAAAELERLVKEEFISKKDAERVRLTEIERFARSELFASILSARDIKREFRFNLTLPATLFTENEELRARLVGQELLVQGVIDCLIETERGDFILIDYKTDRLTREELASPDLAGRRLCLAHKTQLEYYALAVEKIFARRPSKILIYSLHLGREIEVV